MTQQWKNARYACLNYGEAYAPDDIEERSICINGDIRDILDKLHREGIEYNPKQREQQHDTEQDK